MNNLNLEYVYAPGISLRLVFDPVRDFLGNGTVGEVFRATVQHGSETHARQDESSQPREQFALKRFLDRGERPHFARECRVLEALARVPHPYIVNCLSSWTSNDISYMLFPLAVGDLHHFFRSSPPTDRTAHFAGWFTRQLWGLCDALKYLHNYTLPALGEESEVPMHRIGFHHDLKPVNILLFNTGDPRGFAWKMNDFGSGTVSDFTAGEHGSVYNAKASTGDPIYTAPEFAVEGRVSRPKDIWSLGCIFLEAMIWALDPCRTALDDFQKEREVLPADARSTRRPMYWYQDRRGSIRMHPATSRRLRGLKVLCRTQETRVFEELRRLVTRMLTIGHKKRPRATQLCDELERILLKYRRSS